MKLTSAVGVSMAVVAGLHLLWFSSAAVRKLVAVPDSVARFDPSLPPNRSQLEPNLVRLLPLLLEHVPADAPVLVLTGLPPRFPFELYTAPRPMRLLQRFDEAFKDRPGVRADVRARFDFLEETGRRYTPERLHEALQGSRYLLTFFPDEEQTAQLTSEECPAVVTEIEVRVNAKGQTIGVYEVRPR